MRRATCGGAAALFFAATAAAQGAPPWVGPHRIPLPKDVKAATILRRDEPLLGAPNGTAARRGAARLGARLPVFGAELGPGCAHEWLLVGPTAWVCSDLVRVSDEAPSPGPTSASSADGLPERYYFVGSEGAVAYRDLATAGESKPIGELQDGFAVSVTEVGNGAGGDAFVRTTKGLWLPLANLSPVRPPLFHGYDVADGKLERGWVVVDSATVYVAPGEKGVNGTSRHRWDTVDLLEEREAKQRRWVRVGDGQWLDERDVRFAHLAPPPAEARRGERWIDVDQENQVLTAYEGERPVFTTLVSTGVGKGRDITATPLGVHRVWVKLLTSDMTNLEDEDARRYYAIEEVPWVLFFEKGYGFHGAFWHHSFGHVRSHGCVNLTPLDAEHLFRWSSPRLPDGWSAALPTDYDPGTLVRVR
jgi:hypothetical protein